MTEGTQGERIRFRARVWTGPERARLELCSLPRALLRTAGARRPLRPSQQAWGSGASLRCKPAPRPTCGPSEALALSVPGAGGGPSEAAPVRGQARRAPGKRRKVGGGASRGWSRGARACCGPAFSRGHRGASPHHRPVSEPGARARALRGGRTPSVRRGPWWVGGSKVGTWAWSFLGHEGLAWLLLHVPAAPVLSPPSPATLSCSGESKSTRVGRSSGARPQHCPSSEAALPGEPAARGLAGGRAGEVKCWPRSRSSWLKGAPSLPASPMSAPCFQGASCHLPARPSPLGS